MSKKRSYCKSSARIHPSHTGYNFRLAVPSDLQTILNRKELRYSLRTRLQSIAKKRAARMAVFAERFFLHVRREKGGANMSELTGDQLLKILRTGLKECLEQGGVTSLDGTMQEHPAVPILHDIFSGHYQDLITEADKRRLARPAATSPDDLKQRVTEYTKVRDALRNDLQNQNYAQVWRLLDGILQEHGIAIDPHGPDGNLYDGLCQIMMKNLISTFGVMAAREENRFVSEKIDQHLIREPKPEPEPVNKPDDTGEVLWSVVEKYVEEQERGGNWRPRTKDEFQACLNTLKDVIGNVPVKSINFETMRQYKDILVSIRKPRILYLLT